MNRVNLTKKTVVYSQNKKWTRLNAASSGEIKC